MSWLKQWDTLTLVHVPRREELYQEDNGSSGCFIYGRVIAFIVAQVHDTKGLVCEILSLPSSRATLLSI